MSEQFVPLRGNKNKPKHTHAHKIKLLWWQKREKLPIPDACFCYTRWCMSTQLECARNSRLLWDQVPGLCPGTQSPPAAASVASHTSSTPNTVLFNFVWGTLKTQLNSHLLPCEYHVGERKGKQKLSKNRGKNKSLTGLWFVLYSTSISCWKRAFLFPQNTLHACMTELHYLAFQRQKLSRPKQLAKQH